MDKRNTVENDLQNGISRFAARLNYLRGKSKKLSWYRLSIFFISFILFFYFFFSGSTLPLYLTIAVFFILFGILTGIHNKLESGIRRNIVWTNIKKVHIARMNLQWDELPPSLFNPDRKHPFEFDLDVTGEYSLHRLINTAESIEGSSILRDWLISINPDSDVIEKRQLIVKELAALNRFRDKLSLNSKLLSKKELKGTKILDWINTPAEYDKIRRILLLLFVIIPVNIVFFILFILNILPAYFAFISLLYISVHWINGKYVTGNFEELLEIEDEFGKFSVLFDFLEKYPYRKDSYLQKFCLPFIKNSPSGEFRKIKSILNAIGITRNPLVALVLNAIFPYNFFFALKLEKVKLSVKDELPVWLNTWYELEAYNSLANYAYLNPQCAFPVITDGHSCSFTAEGISHPLIRFENNIPNYFAINNRSEVFIITGSNMSGKSTFLKTIGTNLVLAYAGGVVNADKLNSSLFRIFCCINISDSVIDGISYFYAEVKRLKHLLNELNNFDSYPVLFLIDEIFRGTNNVERLKGSRSYIKEAVKLNGAGIVSTHDLELARLAEEITSVKNYHFREEAVEAKMIFDYKIHP
ncbi:MAG: hypothetical protein EHM47_18785, partial [Ignavibacteriales bacterium]